MSNSVMSGWHVVENSWAVTSIYDADDNLIAEVHINEDVTDETQEVCELLMSYKAHLIAAAPKLLEALQDAVALLEDLKYTSDAEPRSAVMAYLKEANQVISKANGN